jgi:hypothetical protein
MKGIGGYRSTMATTMSRKLGLLFLLASLICPAAAMTISVVPAEGKDYAPPPDGSGSPLGYLMSGCMGVLFDSGWIVTDAEAFRGPRSAWSVSGGALAGTLEGAREGLVDYLIALYVDWTPSSFLKGTLLPAAVAYSIVRVADGKIIIEGEVEGSPDTEQTADHFAEAAARVGAGVALSCVKPLRALAMGGEL